ncbi:MAG TPA: MerR family transcriptional regulator [Nocardioidaceae bacterium]|nr:MerR family transcriptional regulator [Nocardioidaceae bacterium]
MTTSLPSSRRRMSIGEVLGQLRPDFPDVTISKIRYLEAEGLVEPERTSSGYRKFSADDVERLRYVLTAQRENYYPLKVIREHLDAMDRGFVPPAGPAGEPQAPQVPLVVLAGEPEPGRGEGPDLRLSRAELLVAAQIDQQLLEQIEGFGLLAPGRNGHYDAAALLVATTVGELAAYGLEPRHLRSIKSASDREADLVEQVVTPQRRQRDASAQARADETVRQLSTLTLRLHTALVRQALGSR